MNQSDKELIPLKVGVLGKSAGTLLAGIALGGPVGLVVAGLGVAMGVSGVKWVDAEAERMESERRAGKIPERPKVGLRGP